MNVLPVDERMVRQYYGSAQENGKYSASDADMSDDNRAPVCRSSPGPTHFLTPAPTFFRRLYQCGPRGRCDRAPVP